MAGDSIGVFDSGAGGISVLNECRKLLPYENFLYYADNANIPYGGRSESEIEFLTLKAVKKMTAYGLKALVVACNTATCASISAVRKEYNIIVVGTEPAVKPAAGDLTQAGKELNLSTGCGKKILILCTEATSRQQRFKSLISAHGAQNFIVAPQKNLAALVENNAGNLGALAPAVREILNGYLKSGDVSGIVLGCTHYVFLRPLIQEIVGCGVRIYDGNGGVARNLKRQLAEKHLLKETGFIPPTEHGKVRIICSGGLPPSYSKLL